MGSMGIIIDPPGLDDPARHRQATEHVLVEALVAEAAVEAFNEGVLHRLAGRDVVPVEPPDDQRSTAVLVSSQP